MESPMVLAHGCHLAPREEASGEEFLLQHLEWNEEHFSLFAPRLQTTIGEKSDSLLGKGSRHQVVRGTIHIHRNKNFPAFRNVLRSRRAWQNCTHWVIQSSVRHLVQLDIICRMYGLVISLAGYLLWFLGVGDHSVTKWPLGWVPNKLFWVIEGSN